MAFVSSNEGDVSVSCFEEGAELKGEAFDLLVHLYSNLHLWSQHLGRDPKNYIMDTSSGNEFPLEGGTRGNSFLNHPVGAQTSSLECVCVCTA